MAVLKYKENGVWKNLSFVATQGDTVDLSGYVQKNELLDLIYPVGSIYMSMSDINPSVIFGGTWAKTAAGRVLVGQYDGMEEFDTVGKYGGEFTHTLTEGEIPTHAHSVLREAPGWGESMTLSPWISYFTNGSITDSGSDGQTGEFWNYNAIRYTGGGQPHNNLQPYLVVNIWERKA